MIRNAQIISSGMYVPERVVPNSYFNELLGEDVDTWLVENLAIKERRWCSENQSTAELCVEAARKILEDGKTSAEELDLIIIATDTPEYISPSTASVVQFRLNAVNAVPSMLILLVQDLLLHLISLQNIFKQIKVQQNSCYWCLCNE